MKEITTDQIFKTVCAGLLFLSIQVSPVNAQKDNECSFTPQQDGVVFNLDKNYAEALKDQLKAITKDLQKENSKDTATDAANVKTIKDKAQVRKDRFVELLRENAPQAAAELLSNADRNKLGAVTQGCVEQPTELKGKLSVQVADNIEQGVSKVIYTLTTDDGQKINLHPISGLRKSLKSGQRIHVQGLRIDNEVLFDGRFDLENADYNLGGADVL